MHTGILTVRFSEAIRVNTVNVTQITFQETQNQTSSNFYDLTGGQVVTQDNGLSFTMEIDTNDLNIIKQLALATGSFAAFVRVTDKAVSDMNGNPVIAVSSSEAVAVATFVADESSPSLV